MRSYRWREGALAEVVAHSEEYVAAKSYARLDEALFVVFNKPGHFALGQPGGSGDSAQRPPMCFVSQEGYENPRTDVTTKRIRLRHSILPCCAANTRV